MRMLPPEWRPAEWELEVPLIEYLHDALFWGLVIGIWTAVLAWWFR